MTSNHNPKLFSTSGRSTIFGLIIYSALILLILPNLSYFCEAGSSSTNAWPYTNRHLTSKKAPKRPAVHPRDDDDDSSSEEGGDPFKEKTTLAPPFVVTPTDKHTATIIFLHGLFYTGEDWTKILGKMNQSHVKIVCPNTEKWPGLFDDRFAEKNELLEFDNTTKYVRGLIDEEIKAGIKPERIIVGGFSQGGAIALQTVFAYPKKLGGIVLMSAWMPTHNEIKEENVPANKNIPVLQCHGEKDKIVEYNIALSTANHLKKLTENADFKTYPEMEHQTSKQELEDIRQFFIKHLAPE